MKSWLPLFLFAALMIPAGAQVKNQNQLLLEKTIIPEISLKDASLSSVLEYLSQKAGGKTPLNFVPLYPPEYADKKITLELTQVPLKVLLDYIGDLAGVQFIPDPHAIRVIVPKKESNT